MEHKGSGESDLIIIATLTISFKRIASFRNTYEL